MHCSSFRLLPCCTVTIFLSLTSTTPWVGIKRAKSGDSLYIETEEPNDARSENVRTRAKGRRASKPLQSNPWKRAWSCSETRDMKDPYWPPYFSCWGSSGQGSGGTLRRSQAATWSSTASLFLAFGEKEKIFLKIVSEFFFYKNFITKIPISNIQYPGKKKILEMRDDTRESEGIAWDGFCSGASPFLHFFHPFLVWLCVTRWWRSRRGGETKSIGTVNTSIKVRFTHPHQPLILNASKLRN